MVELAVVELVVVESVDHKGIVAVVDTALHVVVLAGTVDALPVVAVAVDMDYHKEHSAEDCS